MSGIETFETFEGTRCFKCRYLVCRCSPTESEIRELRRRKSDNGLNAPVAQAWCSPENEHKEMDVLLAKRIVSNVQDQVVWPLLDERAELKAELTLLKASREAEALSGTKTLFSGTGLVRLQEKLEAENAALKQKLKIADEELEVIQTDCAEMADANCDNERAYKWLVKRARQAREKIK